MGQATLKQKQRVTLIGTENKPEDTKKLNHPSRREMMRKRKATNRARRKAARSNR